MSPCRYYVVLRLRWNGRMSNDSSGNISRNGTCATFPNGLNASLDLMPPLSLLVLLPLSM